MTNGRRPSSVGVKTTLKTVIASDIRPFLVALAAGAGKELATFAVDLLVAVLQKAKFDVPGEKKPLAYEEMSPAQRDSVRTQLLEKYGAMAAGTPARRR